MPPTALINSLEAVRRRVRSLSLAYGAGIAIAVAVGLLTATVLLDYLLNLPPVPRIVVMLLSLAGLGYVLTQWVVRPWMSRLRLSDVAGKIEIAFPDFNDRLRSTVDFISKGTPGSDVMKDRVISEATELAHRFDLNAAIETKPVWHSSLVAGGSLLALAILAALLGPEYLSPAISRLLTPFGGHAWPKRVEIQLVNPLPQRVPVGRRVNVQIKLAKGDRASREARMFYQYGDGRVETEIMSRGADGIYSASLDARSIGTGNGAMKVWMEAGDDQTSPKSIGIVQRLAVTGVQLLVTPPAYVAGGTPTTVQLDAAPATVTYGSNLTVNVTFNKDLDAHQAVALSSDQAQSKLPTITWDSPSGGNLVGHWMARESALFQVHAFDTDGFSNADMSDYQVIVRQDSLPTIQITKPARNEECTPQAVIPLRGIAEDDFGIKSLQLLAVKLGDKPLPYAPIDLIKDGKPLDGVTWNPIEGSGEMHRWQIDFPWDLAKLDAAGLKPGDNIEYCLAVQDNFNFEGKTHEPVISGRYRISIMSQDQFTALMSDLMGQVRDQLIEVRNSQRSLKDQTTDLKSQTQKQPEFTGADRSAAQALIARQTTAAAQTKQASSKLNDLVSRMDQNKSTAQDLKDIASAVKDDLNQVAERPMKDATSQIDDARNQKANPKDDAAKQQQATDARNSQLDKAQNNQQAAAEKLDQLVSRIGEVGGLPKSIEQLKAILAQQQAISKKSDDLGMRNLGKQPDQMSAADRKAQQDAANDQKNLADKTDKAAEQMAAAAKKAEKSDPAASQAMKQAAQTAQDQKVASQMRSASQSQQQNQQSAAQQAQAQAEVGLQMMIRQLEEAQQRKLEELAKKLADLQEQVQSLIRQQAALNYSNLAIQGGDVLKKTDQKVIDGLIEKAEWTKDQLPPLADLGTQTRLQEQAERNSRNVAKTAESLQDGAIIVAALNRAADRMSRAIVFLREDSTPDNEKLAGAYDPPQVEALAALQSAKDAVDQQAQKNAAALNQQKKDSIRVAYEKILESQKKLDAETKTIDKAPRTADGQLDHRNSTRLAQLPTEQAGLADRTGKIGDDLNALGGIVYVWANKDIVDSMKSVKEALTKPQTGTVTQAEQTRIEDQLTAMIDSLKSKPKQSAFAQPKTPGAGKGSGGAPPLPPEAELRLLRQLQAAVNKSTKTVSDQGNPEEPVLISLGGRQGQLRTLLDQMLQKTSKGKIKLGPEPDAADKLPEEAGVDKIDDQELQHALLNDDGQPDGDQQKKDLNLVGQRMARSKQRLALDKDPGAVTQEIQKRILIDMDQLIEMARAQQSQSKSPSPAKGQQPGQAQGNQPNPGQGPQNQRPGQNANAGKTPAGQSTANRDTNVTGTSQTDIAQTMKEWGGTSPRKRAAVIEAASEKPIEKFKNFIDDYYRALGERATDPNK